MAPLAIKNRAFLFLKKRAFAFLVLSFLVLRLGTLLTAIEYIPWVHVVEELYRGTIAKELIEGLKVPLWDYQADHYDGGSLWMGVLAVPFFLLLGPNLFALKLVPLLFSLATLILSFYFFKRFFDRKTALFVSALLVLPPPVFTVNSLAAIGSHTESIFFSSAELFCFYQFLYGEKNKTLFLILFGLTGGLGFWFTSITFLTLFTCFVSWFLIDRRSFFGQQMLVFLGSLGVGLLPLILYNLTHREGMFQFLSYAFLWGERKYPGPFLWGEAGFLSLTGKLKSIPLRMVTLVFETLPVSFCFPSFFHLSRHLLSGLYGLVVMSLLVPFFWREGPKLLPLVRDSLREGKVAQLQIENTKLIPFLLFPFFFILAYSVSNYTVSYPLADYFYDFRYLSPLYYFAFSLLALALRFKKRPIPFLAMLLGMGLIGQGPLLFKEPVGRILHYQGYSYAGLGTVWGGYFYPFPQKLGEALSQANRFRESERRFLYWGMADIMDYYLERKMLWDSARILEAIHRVPPPYRPYFLENWGRKLCRRMGLNFDYQIAALGFNQRVANLAATIPQEEQPYFYYGLATKTLLEFPPQTMDDCFRSIRAEDLPYPRMFYFYLGRSFYLFSVKEKKWNKAAIEILDSLGAEEKAWIWRGMGHAAAGLWIYMIALKGPNPLWSKIPSESRAEFFWGIGWGVREQMMEDKTRALDRLHRLPKENQASALEGLQAFEKWHGIA